MKMKTNMKNKTTLPKVQRYFKNTAFEISKGFEIFVPKRISIPEKKQPKLIWIRNCGLYWDLTFKEVPF